MTKCLKCGKKIDKDIKFCPECGAKIEEEKETKKEERKKSKGKLKPKKQVSKTKIIIPIILGIIIVLISVSVFTGRMGTFTSNLNVGSPSQSCRDVQVPYEDQEEYLKTEYYTETVPYTDTECETKELSYSVDNTAFDYDTCNQKEDLCIKYFLGICTEKKTYCVDRSAMCSLDLRNLDLEEGGTWTIKHTFYETGTRDVIRSTESSVYLYPQTTKRVSGIIRITSQGETGDANKDIASCNYQITNKPTKQVCRDVIKYREVQRERQVTAYRPITKYRTEQKCD